MSKGQSRDSQTVGDRMKRGNHKKINISANLEAFGQRTRCHDCRLKRGGDQGYFRGTGMPNINVYDFADVSFSATFTSVAAKTKSEASASLRDFQILFRRLHALFLCLEHIILTTIYSPPGRIQLRSIPHFYLNNALSPKTNLQNGRPESSNVRRNPPQFFATSGY